MAPKNKSRLVDQPPSASSSEEQEQVEESIEEEEDPSEEEEGEEEESGEESEEDEDEEPKTAPPAEKKPVTQKPLQTPQKPQSSSDSGTEDGSGSESESESGRSQPSPSASDFTVKPSVPAKAAPSKPATKRPQETQKEKDSRRKKPKIAEEEEKKSATTPIRLWSDEDQIAVLKGMAEFKAQKGTEPNADMSAFHDFIKGKLQVDVSKSQLSDKLRRLKKKFLTNMKDGEDPVFSKPHDHLVFEYSKKIWGAPGGKGDAGTSNGVKENVNNSTNGKAKKNIEVKKSAEPKKSAKVSTLTKPKDDEKHKEQEKQVAVKEVVKEDTIVKGDQQDFQSKYPRLAASFESMADMSTRYPNAATMLKANMSLIASDKAEVLEEKWKKLEDDEADLMVKRLNLIAEHYKLVVDAMRGN